MFLAVDIPDAFVVAVAAPGKFWTPTVIVVWIVLGKPVIGLVCSDCVKLMSGIIRRTNIYLSPSSISTLADWI